MKPKLYTIAGHKIWLRPDSESDMQAAKEVLEKRTYVRSTYPFDVEPGELWLDLGANIGAFAVYARARGATAVCYEPDKDNFRILQRNAGNFACQPYAVTASNTKEIKFWRSKNLQNNYRGTECEVQGYVEHAPVLNLYAGELKRERYDGVKMDIEGSEGPILDEWLLPRCNKLVLEYHTSRCDSVQDLQRRLYLIKTHFREVRYPKVFDEVIAQNQSKYRPRFDQLIFAWNSK